MLKPRLIALATFILAAAATRLIPHPPNLTSIGAVALFGGAYFADKRLAFAVPLAALFLSDLVLGFYAHMWVVYVAFLLIVCIGLWLQQHKNIAAIGGAAVAGSVLFYLITNFAGFHSGLYPQGFGGIVASYIAGIPFFWNTLIGDLFFTAVLFGGFALLERQFDVLRDRPAAQAA